MLALAEVTRLYEVGEGYVTALDAVSLTVEDGDFLAIVGPSGSGKSTLLQILGLLDRPTSGRVELDGNDVGELSDRVRTRLRLQRIGFVFQRFHLLHELSAMENVALPMEAAGVDVLARFDRAAQLLQTVGLGDRLEFRPARLSGGQRQRVAIARALANNPSMVFADEPTGELHTEDKAQVVDLFRQFNRNGHTVVVVTHDPDVAAVARRQIELRDGRIRRVTSHESKVESHGSTVTRLVTQDS